MYSSAHQRIQIEKKMYTRNLQRLNDFNIFNLSCSVSEGSVLMFGDQLWWQLRTPRGDRYAKFVDISEGKCNQTMKLESNHSHAKYPKSEAQWV